MELYTKEGQLLLVQVDHLDGEMIGDLIKRFYEKGAKNVQVISTVTKKNRPGHMIFIDASIQKIEELEQVIVKECGASGWHRIATSHRHTRVSVQSKKVMIRTRNHSWFFQIEAKVIEDDWRQARPEYENCVMLRRLLYEKEHIECPMRKIQMYLAEAFRQDKKEIFIEEE